MGNRRKARPKLDELHRRPASECTCWFCGNTLNVPPAKYDGLCMSCFFDFHEDDIALELFGLEAMPCTNA